MNDPGSAPSRSAVGSTVDDGASEGGAAADQSAPMNRPLHRTPVAFRCWFAGSLVAAVAGLALLYAWAPGPPLAEFILDPGAVLLLALILLADLYPNLPWTRRSKPFDEFIFSTPLAIAALLSFGPQAAVVFVIAGVSMTLVGGMRWWRRVLNIGLVSLQGAIAAGVLALFWDWAGWTDQVPQAALIPMTLALAVVIEGLNVVLVMTSQCLAGATTPRGYLADWRRQLAIGALDLTAPIPAVLATEQPALLPLLALAMIAAQAGLSAVTSRTAEAGTDPLTALPNRAYLLARLRSRLGTAEFERDPLTVLLVDLDHFKEINDDLGHLAGDQVLVEVARRLEASIRSTDVVARFGGDEFAVLLMGGSGGRSVDDVAGRIRAAIARPMTIAQRTIRVGVTLGWTTADREDVDPLALLERADVRLYAAKAARGPRGSRLPSQPSDRPTTGVPGPVWTVAQGRTVQAHDGGAPAATGA